jgi:hypothetical protein
MIILQTAGLLGWVISLSQGLYLNTGQHKHKINTYQTSMHCVGFEPTIQAYELAKTVHVLDRSATVTGQGRYMPALNHRHFESLLGPLITRSEPQCARTLNPKFSSSVVGPWPPIFSFMIILHMAGLLGRVISSSQGLCLNTGQHKQNKHIHIPNIHALCGILTHDPGYRDRPRQIYGCLKPQIFWKGTGTSDNAVRTTMRAPYP